MPAVGVHGSGRLRLARPTVSGPGHGVPDDASCSTWLALMTANAHGRRHDACRGSGRCSLSAHGPARPDARPPTLSRHRGLGRPRRVGRRSSSAAVAATAVPPRRLTPRRRRAVRCRRPRGRPARPDASTIVGRARATRASALPRTTSDDQHGTWPASTTCWANCVRAACRSAARRRTMCSVSSGLVDAELLLLGDLVEDELRRHRLADALVEVGVELLLGCPRARDTAPRSCRVASAARGCACEPRSRP